MRHKRNGQLMTNTDIIEVADTPVPRWKTYRFWRDFSAIGLLAIIAFMLISSAFPAPYNLQYQVKRAFYNPTAVCKDGIYSFAATRAGSCSGHGGVQTWLPR